MPRSGNNISPLADLPYADLIGQDWESAEPGAEGEDDLAPLLPGGTRAVVTGTDWTTETIIRLLERNTIQLDPAFQRRDAWTLRHKSRFIESLILGLPIPQLVLAEKKDKPGQFIVIDGKQRLLTLHQFAGTPASGTLQLTGMPTLKELNGLTCKQLDDDARFIDHMEAFRNQPIRTVVVKNWPDENFLYLVFLRLNTGSVPLAPQELRQALHPGPFLAFANIRSAESEPLRDCLRINKPDFRMRDVELMVRFYAFKYLMSSYTGNMKQFLDDTCLHLNNRWGVDGDGIRQAADELDASITFAKSVFSDWGVFSIPLEARTGFKQRGRFNRTVFDIFTYYLSDPAVRKLAESKVKSLRKGFEKLCVEKPDFLYSLQVTTKSLTAVVERFHTFGLMLSRIVKQRLPVPRLHDNRIELG